MVASQWIRPAYEVVLAALVQHTHARTSEEPICLINKFLRSCGMPSNCQSSESRQYLC